jgi:hypothetical protein
MLKTVTSSTSVESKARQEIFSATADMNKPEYESAVIAAGKMYRGKNPTAKPGEAIKAIGRLARAALGLPEPQGGDQAQAGNTPAKPFRPARPGGSGTPPAPRPKPRQTEGEPDWGELAKDE